MPRKSLKDPKVLPRDLRLVNTFAEAAKHWGYQEDQGVGSAVQAAADEFNEVRRKLLRRLRSLTVWHARTTP